MTKEQFLARCANAYDMGLASDKQLALLDRWIDFVMRLEGGQTNYVVEFLESERNRTNGFHSGNTLANDDAGYGLVRLAAVLSHPCQACAVDPDALHTRGAFCQHKDKP